MNFRVVAAAALLVVGVGAVGYAVFQPTLGSAASNGFLTATATVTDVVDQVVANGTVSATRTYGLAFGSAPYLIDDVNDNSPAGSETWTVEEVMVVVGQKVSAGDVLATADDTSARTSVDLATANLAVAQARYDADIGGLSESDLAQAQIPVDQAEQALTSAGISRDETARQNTIRLRQAKDALADAKQKLDDDRDADAPQSVIKADKDAVAAAQDSLDLERIQIQSSNRQAQDQVDSAQRQLDSANLNFESATAPVSDEQIASDWAALIQAQKQLDDAEELLDHATLTAPVDGTVVSVSVVAGLPTGSGRAIELMSDQLEVNAEFSESDLPSVALGQAASITISATDAELSGEVVAVAQTSSSSGSGSVVSYRVTILLADVPAAVRPGMSAEVAVTTAEAQGVLAIPSIALTGAAGNYSVRVVDASGQVTVRQVTVGLVSTSMAEIESGITAGDEVVTGTTTSQNSNAPGFGLPGGGGPRVIPGGGPAGPGQQVGP